MSTAISFLVGIVFGIGIIVGGMSNPAKVLAFLDIGGQWDPSLALVMAGAIAVGVAAFRLARGRHSSLLGEPMQIPDKTAIDTRLLLGSALFGVGWGLAGICPGPALILLGSASLKGLIFVIAMLAGMGLFHLFKKSA
ncbi:MAG TPA: hypothetical protein PLS67_03880 [Accumulibacter sp.]|jgi:hypothetical protein|nr:hypothetical protein [Accumulibacter sp.]HQC79648.1 hypothetical protein [Accumulibacter sp.]